MVTQRDNQCGSKHLKWAAIIIGTVLTICGGALKVAKDMASEHEPRIRKLENDTAIFGERMKHIISLCEDIKANQTNESASTP